VYRDDLALAFAKQGMPLKSEELVELLGPCARHALVTVVPRVL
jgi:hypothetical protein